MEETEFRPGSVPVCVAARGWFALITAPIVKGVCLYNL